jgi:hypothetical protein
MALKKEAWHFQEKIKAYKKGTRVPCAVRTRAWEGQGDHTENANSDSFLHYTKFPPRHRLTFHSGHIHLLALGNDLLGNVLQLIFAEHVGNEKPEPGHLLFHGWINDRLDIDANLWAGKAKLILFDVMMLFE